VASTGNWVVMSVLTLVVAVTLLSPDTAQAAAHEAKKRARVAVKPLIVLRNKPQTTVVTVRRGSVHRDGRGAWPPMRLHQTESTAGGPPLNGASRLAPGPRRA